MKQEDINNIKELCEANGYYFDFDIISETAVVAKAKKITVNIKDWGWKKQSNNSMDFDFKFNTPVLCNSISTVQLAEYLAKQLEEYLNEK